MLIVLSANLLRKKVKKIFKMDRTKKLMEIYQALWLSADFENDFEMKFPSQFRALKWNENKISDEDLKSMYNFLKEHPVFN